MADYRGVAREGALELANEADQLAQYARQNARQLQRA